MSDMELSVEEKNQKRTAVIVITAINFSKSVISNGLKEILLYYKAKVKTKHDYMLSHKRDMRYTKQKEDLPVIDYDAIEDGVSKYSALGIQDYKSPYLVGYEKKAFHDGMKLIHKTFESFSSIASIDLSGQLIGLSGMKKLCEHIERCPVRSISLANNDLNDECLEIFSRVQRSLGSLESLYLNQNRFTDAGIEKLFGENTYSSSLKLLNVTRNKIGTRSAYFLGQMFSPERKSAKLENLILGGSVNSKSFGDDFIRILFYFLSLPGARPIVSLTYADAGVDIAGINTLISIIACCSELNSLNITRNYLSITNLCKKGITLSLNLSTSIKDLYIGNGGLTQYEKKIMERNLLKFGERRGKMTWHENTLVLSIVAGELWASRNIERRMAKVIFNEWRSYSNPKPDNPVDVTHEMLCSIIELDEETSEIAMSMISPKLVPADIPLNIIESFTSLVDMIKWCVHLSSTLSSLKPTPKDQHTIKAVKLKQQNALVSLKLFFSSLAEFRLAAYRQKKRRYTSQANNAVSSQLLLMLLEDCYSFYFEYSAAIEVTIGTLNREIIMNSASGSGSQDLERNQISFLQHDMLESYFIHYYYFGLPIDKSRAQLALIAAERAERIRKLEEDRRSKNSKSKKKKSKRRSPSSQKDEIISPAAVDSNASLDDNNHSDMIASLNNLKIDGTADPDVNDVNDVNNEQPENNFNQLPSTFDHNIRPKTTPNITKYIWQNRTIDILRKRDDPKEMPFKNEGREGRKYYVENNKFQLNNGADNDSDRTFDNNLNSFMEFDRGLNLPKITRFNFFRHRVREEEKAINRIERRVKIREDESK